MNKSGLLKNFNKRAAALLLGLSMIVQQSVLVPSFASEFVPDTSAGMGGVVAPGASGNIYDINPGFVSGSTGFAHFDKFNLTAGDIANLIFQAGGYDKFVNLVNNTVNINGILNTIYSNGAFANGHAIFVSPGGVVIGASGVLNVGALSLITPTTNTYNSFLSNPVENLAALKADSSGNITINGKIISRGDVELYGKNIQIGGVDTVKTDTGIAAGVQNQDVTFDTLESAKELFNNLVSNNLVEGSGYALKDGKVIIVANASDKAVVNLQNASAAGSKIDITASAKNVQENSDPSAPSVTGQMTQETLIDIQNSQLTAKDGISISQRADSGFSEVITEDYTGLPSLDVKSSNTLNIDAASILSGDTVSLSQNSSNAIITAADTAVNLEISNTINNAGTIEGVNSVLINYMNDSENTATPAAVNSLVLNGEIKTGTLFNKTMVIDRDGNITANGFDADDYVDGGNIEFKDIIASTGKIEINGIEKENITGDGQFKVLGGGLSVENYSQKGLIFNAISLDSGEDTGLIINGIKDVNFGEKVNENSNVLLVKEYSDADLKDTIKISNYFDNSNPLLSDATAPDITFNGKILNASGALDILNESGDINFNEQIDVLSKDIVASRGGVVYNSADSILKINAGDRIIAGKNIALTAKEIINNGLVQAGFDNKNITITDGMLSDLITDPSTGETNLVNLNGNDKSAYLNADNNIKVIYKDGEIIIYNISSGGGNVEFNGTLSGDGEVRYTDGYAKVTIDNQTDKNLVINNLSNDRISGNYLVNGVNRNDAAVRQGFDKAETTITSAGMVDIKGVVTNALNKKDTDETGKLLITSQNGVIVNNLLDETGAQIAAINSAGITEIVNETSGSLIIDGLIQNDGEVKLSNSADGGFSVNQTGKISNRNGELNISNSKGNFVIAQGAEILQQDAGNIIVNNTTDAGNFTISGLIKNSRKGDISLSNDASNGLELSSDGRIELTDGSLNINNTSGSLKVLGNIENQKGINEIINSGSGGAVISGIIKNNAGSNMLSNSGDGGLTITSSGLLDSLNGSTTVTNTAGGLTVENGGIIRNNNGKLTVTNSGTAGLSVEGLINNKLGETFVSNTQGGLSVAQNAVVQNDNGKLTVTNSGSGGLTLAGLVDTKLGQAIIQNTNAGFTVTETGIIQNNNNRLDVINSGNKGLSIAGTISNNSGLTNINNTAYGITITENGHVTSKGGGIVIANTAAQGIKVQGEIKTTSSDITINNRNSDVVIGSANTDKNINAGKNVRINQTKGNILNAGLDKTLIAANSNLVVNVIDGNIGATSHDNPGFSVNADTRDITESLNINIGGTVTANAINSAANPDAVRLINLTSKNSDMKVNHIKADGNVILTAADWRQPDQNPTPSDEIYFTGYSILNGATDSLPNVEGQNISVISSNRIGGDKALTYLQRTDIAPDSWVSFEAENNIKLESAKSDNPTNVHQLISKRGSVDFTLGSDGNIKEITSGNHLHILSKAKNLTIYDIGKTTSFADPSEDLLYPHDLISLGGTDGVVPQTVAIEVLDADGGAQANSTLKIYNAYVRGANNGQGSYEKYLDQTFQKADVSLMADNIYAHAYDAPDSTVTTVNRPDGFKPKEEDTVYTGSNGETLYASGFNTVGEGAKLSFDIQGVTKDYVANANGGDSSTRTYLEAPKYQTIEFFNNKYQIPDGTAFSAKEVTLSVNSTAQSEIDGNNRGLNINKIYANNAYVDTKDINLSVRDGVINNYAEFRNGNRFGEGNYPGDYRWLTIVDNDYRRLLPATLQLYTQKTGSFGLEMGNLVVLRTKAPAVHYNPYEVTNLFRNENSFYRLTYKDDKVQYNTTTLGFKDIDKETYKPTKRVSMRFPAKGQNIEANVEVYDISKTGALIDNSKKLKVGDKEHVKLIYEDMDIDVDVEVVRLTDNGLAGVKFVNMKKDVANKILYLNLRRANSMKDSYTSGL